MSVRPHRHSSARRPAARLLHGALCAGLAALLLAGCGSTSVSTSGFKGAEHEAAQVIANLQTQATASEQSKICTQDISAALVKDLGGKTGCEAAFKRQLEEIDNLEISVQAIKIGASGTSALATVHSIVGGKTREQKLTLVKEGGKWRISGLS